MFAGGIFLWLVVQNSLNNRDRLAVSRVVNDTSCEGAVSEFHDHMFFECHYR